MLRPPYSVQMTLLVLLLMVTTWWSVCTIHAQQPDDPTAIITEPANEQQLFGQVQIRGSAGHSTAFESYTLEYDNMGDPAAQWLLVQPRVQQQVQDGILGAWNTIVVPDGVYQLRLRVFLSDGRTGEFIVSNLRVINSAPTPLPAAGGQSDLGVPTPGPSPTSPIAQPPSSAPDSAATGLGEPAQSETQPPALTVDQESTAKTRINTGRIGRAFCSGVYLTLGLFGLMFVYLLLRGRLRPITRRFLWQNQNDLDPR